MAKCGKDWDSLDCYKSLISPTATSSTPSRYWLRDTIRCSLRPRNFFWHVDEFTCQEDSVSLNGEWNEAASASFHSPFSVQIGGLVTGDVTCPQSSGNATLAAILQHLWQLQSVKHLLDYFTRCQGLITSLCSPVNFTKERIYFNSQYLCSNVSTGLRRHTSPMNLVVHLISKLDAYFAQHRHLYWSSVKLAFRVTTVGDWSLPIVLLLFLNLYILFCNGLWGDFCHYWHFIRCVFCGHVNVFLAFSFIFFALQHVMRIQTAEVGSVESDLVQYVYTQIANNNALLHKIITNNYA